MATFLIAIVIVLFLVLLAVTFLGVILWYARQRFTRQRFVFTCLSAYVTVTLGLFTVIGSKFTLWQIAASVVQMINGQQLPVQEPRLMDYAFLLIIYAIAMAMIRETMHSWPEAPEPEEMEQTEQERDGRV